MIPKDKVQSLIKRHKDIEVELIDVQSRDIKNQLLEIEPAIEQEKEKILSKQGS